MRIYVDHLTHYDYSEPMLYAIQRLYLTPRDEPSQRVIRWEVTCSGEMTGQRDAFGNQMTTLVTTRPTQSLAIQVTGEVEMATGYRQQPGGHFEAAESDPPVEVFLRSTALTAPDAEISAFAASHLNLGVSVDRLVAMAIAIEDHLTYSPGVTQVETTAVDAWRRGAGVCQDHAHVLLAACRSQGIPARYVSGYLAGEARASEATHAWADVWVDGHWVSIDVTHRCLTEGRWLRLAVGADYDAVSPVRGVRQGGGREAMRVTVSVSH